MSNHSPKKIREEIDLVEEGIEVLEDISDSTIINRDFRKEIQMLRSEKRNLENEIESSFFEETARDALMEYSDKKMIDMEDGAEKLLHEDGDMNELVSLYKIHLDSDLKDSLPSEKEIRGQLEDYLRNY